MEGLAMLPKMNAGFDLPDMLDRFFNEDVAPGRWGVQAASTTPAVNVTEDDKKYEIDVAAPGLNKEDFNIDVTDGVLSITAEKEEQDKKEEENYIRREFGYTKFQRSFDLPENIKEDKINASYKDGVLKVELPKKEEGKQKAQRKIDIK